jgi:hypothetical protein
VLAGLAGSMLVAAVGFTRPSRRPRRDPSRSNAEEVDAGVWG